MVIEIPGAHYFWKLGRDPLIFLKTLVVIGHVYIYWSKVAEGFSVFNAVLFRYIIVAYFRDWYLEYSLYNNNNNNNDDNDNNDNDDNDNDKIMIMIMIIILIIIIIMIMIW